MKMIIVMRKDLNMRKGKMIAQGAHAVEGLLHQFSDHENIPTWREKYARKKICVGVDSQAELIDIYNKASSVVIPRHLVTDAGFTEFKEPTTTCCAIGPANDEEIDQITGHLKLL